MKRMSDNALWWWGRLCDMERTKMARPLLDLAEKMTPPMRKDLERILPKLRAWLEAYDMSEDENG